MIGAVTLQIGLTTHEESKLVGLSLEILLDEDGPEDNLPQKIHTPRTYCTSMCFLYLSISPFFASIWPKQE